MSNPEISDLDRNTKLALVRKRGAIKGSITKLINSLDETAQINPHALAVKEERLRASFAQFEVFNLELCAMDPDADDMESTEECRACALENASENLQLAPRAHLVTKGVAGYDLSKESTLAPPVCIACVAAN